jgi:molybdopterin-containing oxidoreductase family iron-sulfur binding subunit
MSTTALPRPSDHSAAAQARFWRALDESTASGAAADAPVIAMPWSRRDFMRLGAASLALAGLGGCTRPPLEKIVPYVEGPDQSTYGKPVYFASAHVRDGYASGTLVATHMGRPTKIEGNPLHPASLGATDVFAQASILDLYDPDRSKTVRHGNEVGTWPGFVAALHARMLALDARRGEGLHILTGLVTSPSLAREIDRLRARYPALAWHQYQPLARDNGWRGDMLAFGAPVDTRYRFDRARVVVSLDADFLSALPGSLRYARDFVAARTGAAARATMNRLYVAEALHSVSGAAADHRLSARTQDIAALAYALAQRIGVVSRPLPLPWSAPWLDFAARDLAAFRGASIVIAGERQPPLVHALAHAMNERLGNLGHTVVHTHPVAAEPVDQAASLATLAQAMSAGEVDTLLIVDANPAYDAPADLRFGDALARVPFTAHLGACDDETAARCRWHVPLAHALETWSDTRAYDGTASVLQPCIAPLYDGRSPLAFLDAGLGNSTFDEHAFVRETWRARTPAGFDAYWDATLRDGVAAGTEPPPITPSLRLDLATIVPPAVPAAGALEVVFAPDPTQADGRYANNAWLQELPKPLTTLTWDNAALMGPRLAARLGVANEDRIELQLGDARVVAPVWVVPGQAENTIGVTLGGGRSRAGTVGTNVGFDAYPLRTSQAPWVAGGVSVRKVDGRHRLAATQLHDTMEGRDIVRVMARDAALACDLGACERVRPRDAPTLYPPAPPAQYAWAMSIDLASCIGCAACTIACQAENNVPTVGKSEVLRGREMHWIRVDRYFEGGADNPRTHFMPVPCMQCEHAPCEVVCPVEASVHDTQGLNVQVYNRCVGTRFCSNNCPYKVRRFNFLHYTRDAPSLDAQRNPDVTVRRRGVMEKCSYCIQRIEQARIATDIDGRRIADGEVVTACAAACPTGAIVFGDLNDPASAVNARKRSPLDYALLVELNTRPRTTYLPRVFNPAAPA